MAPSSLNATLDSIGRVTLKWDRSGNKQGTSFIVEWREGTSGTFSFLTVLTRTKYVDVGRTPGVTIEYRVKAVRRGVSSGYSPTASIYAEGWQAPPSLQIAA